MNVPFFLDTASALQLLGDAVDASVRREMTEHGIGDLTDAHGYVIQRLLDGPRTASEVAAEVKITQQGAAKQMAEMLARGYVTPSTSPADRRRRPMELSERGREAVAVARRARAKVNADLQTQLGSDGVELERLLGLALTALGLSEQVARRSVTPPPDMLR